MNTNITTHIRELQNLLPDSFGKEFDVRNAETTSAVTQFINEIFASHEPLTHTRFLELFLQEDVERKNRFEKIWIFPSVLEHFEVPLHRKIFFQRLQKILEGLEISPYENIHTQPEFTTSNWELKTFFLDQDDWVIPELKRATKLIFVPHLFLGWSQERIKSCALQLTHLKTAEIKYNFEETDLESIAIFLSFLPSFRVLSFSNTSSELLPILPQLEKILSKTTHLTSLELELRDIASLEVAKSCSPIFSMISWLKSFSLFNTWKACPIPIWFFHHLISNCKNIENLVFGNIKFWENEHEKLASLFKSIPHLKALSLNYPWLEPIPLSQAIFPYLSQLESLCLPYFSFNTNNIEKYKEIFQPLQNLKYLSLESWSFPTNEWVWNELFSCFPKSILSLDLQGVNNDFTQGQTQSISTHLPNLRHLNLEHINICESLQPDSFESLLLPLQHLDTLSLGYQSLTFSPQEYFDIIQKHPSLKHLNLTQTGLHTLSKELLSDIAHSISHLETLVMDGCDDAFASCESIEAFYGPLKGLKAIKVHPVQKNAVLKALPEFSKIII